MPAWAIDVGLGVSVSATTFTVGDTSGAKIADLQSNLQLGPYIEIASEHNYFGDSPFGYYFYGGYSQGESNVSFSGPGSQTKQTNSTPIKSSMTYVGATLLYAFGDKITKIDKSFQHTVGMGLGLGHLKAYGTVDAALTSTGQPEHIDVSNDGPSVDFYYRYLENNGWFFETRFRNVETHRNDRYYKAADISFSLGRYFSLDFF